ncbi:Transglutaminase-like superfamily protein [Pedobacter sp. ok626]|uniref:lasso peptide biosynthesis B2 protein n=1 Tax=Pedobacter sp. ok626 TaxID=1761882 RepID=UPI00088FDA8E|nr:lasso peptide biosynthesis B2 protein [Pedobacter sp. ok626]SDJ33303.1 Transglutaminase-like superfamily protein [Pedobacter sp. ok626]
MYSDQDLINLNKSLRAYDRMVFQTRVLTILTEATLRFTSLKTTEKLLSFFRKNVPAPDQHETRVILDKYTTLFNQMNQLAFSKGRCLSQSLVMRMLLNRKGISAELKIGLSQHKGIFDSHAWLEKEGVLLNDHPSVIANYLVLPGDKLNTILKFK